MDTGGQWRVTAVSTKSESNAVQNGAPTLPSLSFMHKAANKYEVRKVIDVDETKQCQLKSNHSKLTPQNLYRLCSQVKEVNSCKVTDVDETKQCQLKAILSKLTPQNLDRLCSQVKDVNIDNAVTLAGLVFQIYDNAIMEPTFCEMYASFCSQLAGELPDFIEDNKNITFKKLLLNKCQEEFQRGERERAEADRVEGDGEGKQSDEEREEKRIQALRQKLGNIRLIGELYKKRMLTETIMHGCIIKLLGEYQNPNEEDIEALCELMNTIGEIIDHPIAKKHMDAYFKMMTNLSNNMNLSSRVRLMLKDAIDLRKNKWQQKWKVEKPKKNEELQRYAAQEQRTHVTSLACGPSICMNCLPQCVRDTQMEENSDEHVAAKSSCASSKHPWRSNSVVWEEFEKLSTSTDGKQRLKCKRCDPLCVADVKSDASNMLCQKFEPHDFMSERSFMLDQDIYREKISTTIIKHNYPFMFVEHDGIQDLHSFLNPNVKSITRNTVKYTVLKVYKREKDKLRQALQLIPGRICLTSNLWSSRMTNKYLTLTAHYVDENWVLHKRILSCRHVPPPHSGGILAEKVIHLLKEWGIEKKIFTFTLDNALYNDGLVNFLECHRYLTDTLLCDGEFLYVGCAAHVFDLIVQSSLQVIGESVYKIRECVKYVRGTRGRMIKFAKCVAQFSLKCSKKVRQDVPTKWNSTYLMLDSALLYRRAFYQLQLIDTNFEACPSEEEWTKVERIVRFLKPIHNITTLFSGNRYPTTNLYFHEVWKIQSLIMEEMENPDSIISCMARQMKGKFDKYWECHSMMLSFAIILDPRYKLQFVEFCFNKLNPSTSVERVRIVLEKLYLLFEDYARLSASAFASASTSTHNPSPVACFTSGDNDDDKCDEMDEFDLFESQYQSSNRYKSQLDLYLGENRLDRKQNAHLDVLSYWKAESVRYPELSFMARDILSIPITTGASDSAFSIGGLFFGKYCNSIMSKDIETLLCTRDWLYGSEALEDSDEEELVEDFETIVAGLSTGPNVLD